MFETALIVFVISALVLTLSSGAGLFVLHKMYGPELPPGVRPLENTLRSILTLGSTLLLRPFEFFSRGDTPPASPPRLPPSDIRQLPKQ
jgi:hypothetical protein